MAYKRIEERQKIIKILNHLISKKNEIQAFIKSDMTPYTSRVINAVQNYPALAKGTSSVIFIEKLLPEKGNDLIQSSQNVTIKFDVSDQPCSCSVNYIGISNMPPHLGFMLSMPDIIEVEQKRKEERTTHEESDFWPAEFCIGKDTGDEKRYQLYVIDSSAHGLGLALNESDSDLLERIKVGDTIEDIQFYTSNAMLKIDGIVRHITNIKEGKFKGGYNIGIESEEIIPSW